MPEHHPALLCLEPREVAVPEAMVGDFLGIRTRLAFQAGMAGTSPEGGTCSRALPAFDEEYFEWIDLVETALAARDRFVIFELGAGYGRWMVRAVGVLRQCNPLPYALVGVEGEPIHFRWLQQHLADNGIDPARHELVEAVVSREAGWVRFYAGNPAGWYGQAIDVRAPRRRRRPLGEGLRRRRRDPGCEALIWVEAVRLSALLSRHERVDLVDLDVQGAELDVLTESIDELNRRVKRLHIGTHTREIEAGLRELLSRSHWKSVRDYGCLRVHPTPYGEIEFEDGVQTWVNPRLG